MTEKSLRQEQISRVIGNLDDRHIAECASYAPAGAAASPERSRRVKVKRIITLALAAALILSLGVTAYAVKASVATPEAAQRVALQEIEVWRQMGLLNPEVSFEGDANQIVEIEEHTGSEYWYGRFFNHSFDVRWHLGPVDWGDQTPPPELLQRKFGCNLRVDTLTGKITHACIDARPSEDAVPTGSVELKLGDPDDPENKDLHTLYFYDNFTDIFPADMTVDRFCSLLAEYWGFSGYRLADTVDTQYYDAHWTPPAPESLLKDLRSDNTDNYYLTVFFEGDQEGVPRYIQMTKFPGYVQLSFGTGHSVG